MRLDPSTLWRPCFVLGGALYLAGSSQHPRGRMVEMLADPIWFSAHAVVFVGLLVLTAGFVLLRRRERISSSLARWVLLAVGATALEAAEMGIHALAYMEADALAGGLSTPLLTTHMWLATLVYPVFAVVMVGLIWTGQRERSLGSRWIGWIGLIGAAAHGIVMLLVFLLEIEGATVLFPVAAISLSIWFILAGMWPVRGQVASAPSGPGAGDLA